MRFRFLAIIVTIPPQHNMAGPSSDTKALAEMLAQAQRQIGDLQAARAEDHRRIETLETAQAESEVQTRKTTLPEYLAGCHNHLHSHLVVQDVTLSTKGDPANAENKLRPERLRRWDDFPALQKSIWQEVVSSDFVLERHFTCLHSLEDSGALVQNKLGSELDLQTFQRITVEIPVAMIINRMYEHAGLQRKFHLQGSINFENHANTLSHSQPLEEQIQRLSLIGNQAGQRGSSSDPRTAPASSVRVRADQFCVYNTSVDNTQIRIPAFISEYKAPHKLQLGYINEGLDDMDLQDVIRYCENETDRDRYRRLIAAVITQAFSYMVRSGLEYGYVCTGEAFIFLRVPDDPTTVYYFLSVPKGDVGGTARWEPESRGHDNKLHVTAVGQMLAFTLLALKTPPREQTWQANAAAKLNKWRVEYEELLRELPDKDGPSSEYRPPRHAEYICDSPIQIPLKRLRGGCSSGQHLQDRHDGSDKESDSDSDSPCRQKGIASRTRSQTQQKSRPQSDNRPTGRESRQKTQDERKEQDLKYCTHNCLLGLAKGGSLDASCPNVRDHGESFHRITLQTFRALLRQQLAQSLDIDCKPMGIPGACGVLFQVRLTSYGYTVAAKFTTVDFVRRMHREAIIYNRLRPLQGVCVPVHLGNITLTVPYSYEGIAYLVHMMLLSFGGQRVTRRLITPDNQSDVVEQAYRSAQAIHKFGVLHRDLDARNILWSEDTRRVMIIDFERSEVVKPIGQVRVKEKRKRGGFDMNVITAQQEENEERVFASESRWAAKEVRACA